MAEKKARLTRFRLTLVPAAPVLAGPIVDALNWRRLFWRPLIVTVSRRSAAQRTHR